MRKRLAVVGLVGMSWIASSGCGSETRDDGSLESAAVPPTPSTRFDLAESCTRLVKRHETVRELDVRSGLIRWGCGDVPGVTDPDFGQEYCEYHAVQKGRIVYRGADLDAAAPLECVFTSVFTGAGEADVLGAAMRSPENLGMATQDDDIVEMQNYFNSRSAATGLFRDCQSRGSSPSSVEQNLRMAACYSAWAAGGDQASELRQTCRAATTISDATWQRLQTLGAKILLPTDTGYESQRDVAACLAVRGAGKPWRNSDPMICSRVARAAAECACDFEPVPSSVMGVAMTGWSNDALPTGCRFARVSGQDYPSLVLCRATEEDVADIPLNAQHSRSVQTFCHDRFGVDIVLKLPFRALATPGTCSSEAGFCSAYMHGAQGQD